MSARLAPTARAIRSVVTKGQLRQTNACNRLGKCGNGSGLGAEPLGRSVTASAEDGSAPKARGVPKDEANAKLPSAVELALIKLRRDHVVVDVFVFNL